MLIRRNTYIAIRNYFQVCIPEKGGILGGRGGIITHFIPDKSKAFVLSHQYVPNIKYLNSILRTWHDKNIDFYGIIHSHPPQQPDLSHADALYIKKISACMPWYINRLYFPIALENEIKAYRVKINTNCCRITPVALKIIL